MKRIVSVLLLSILSLCVFAQRAAFDFKTKCWGYKSGERWTVEPIYQDVSKLGHEKSPAKLGGKWGMIDINDGTVLIPFEYDRPFVFDKGEYAKVIKNGNVGYIDMNNKWYDNISSGASLQDRKGSKKNPSLRYDVGKEHVYKVGDYIPFMDEEGLWGYMQYNEPVIDAKWDFAGPFFEGLAAVALNGKYGYIDKDGKCVIPYRYEFAGEFHDGLAAACQNGKYGFVDKSGRSAIPYKFEDAGQFDNGLAAVIFSGTEYYVDTDGNMYASREEVRRTYSSFAKQFVESHVNAWQKKGKYEKTADWQKRVNESTRNAVIDSLLILAEKEYIAYQGAEVENRQNIVEYDADGEIFLIYDERFGSLLVPVPVSQAESFEHDFSMMSRENQYYVSNDVLALKSSVFLSPDGKKYIYNNVEPLEFASVDIVYNFENIDVVDVASSSTSAGAKQQIERKSINAGKSDVDLNIPVSGIEDEKTFAVIIANEKYQSVSEVSYAESDGRTFRDYCIKTLGIPDRNIRFVPNATLVNMWAQVDWLTNIAKVHNGGARLIFYYAGHGIPDESSRDAYLLPVDGTGANIRTGYKLGELYSSLSKYPSNSVLVFLDACFSGAERSGNMLASARGVALKAKKEVPEGNMVVFSAAQGDETAYKYEDKGHGLFTYFLLKRLQETGGKVSLGDLSGYISEQVSKYSVIENSKTQTPSVIPSESMGGWKDMPLRLL